MRLNEKGRLVVVSNRLPWVIEVHGRRRRVRGGSGGLVSALTPILEREGGLWIGYPGFSSPRKSSALARDFGKTAGFKVKPVHLSETLLENYYQGFSNGTIWPLFHDLLGYTEFDSGYWDAYREANRLFARVVERESSPSDMIWIHDYHLMLVGSYLKRSCPDLRTAFFLHIPFPDYGLFRRLPWSKKLIEGLLAYRQIGFQTSMDRRNFISCVRQMIPGAVIEAGRAVTRIRYGDETVRVGVYPISIDFEQFDSAARKTEVREEADRLKQSYGCEHLILGLDRLDYTKGISARFRAFEFLLERNPEWLGRVSLVQVVVPSRTDVERYRDVKENLDGQIGRINGRFSERGWVPIHYHFKHLSRSELVAHYLACEVALITPFRDGMNLVSKEYCAANHEGSGTLILSEFAGASRELNRGALLVNPYDIIATAETIDRTLKMGAKEREVRMTRMRKQIQKNDVYQWVGQFLHDFSEATVYPEEEETQLLPGLAS